MGAGSPERVSTPAGAVFLSYASQDTDAARRICDALRESGIEVWFDQSELRGGDAWDQKIRRQIRDCALFMPIISANTQTRPEGYFRFEWKLAVDRSHLMADDEPFLLPVVIDGTLDASARVPDKFRQIQWTRLPDGTTSQSFADQISRLLAHEAQAPQVSPVPLSEVPRRTQARPWFRLAVGLMTVIVLVAAAYFALGRLVLPKRISMQTTHLPATQSIAPPRDTLPEKSVAVLPFVDMSEKHDQEYFADGLTEELIDRLSQSPDLKVIARTSSFHYKGRNDDVRTIAAALGVRHLLEGSVRKSGRHLRVAVQLLRASDGSHIWSDTYDQQAQDIFGIQTEIANTVTRRLNASIGDSSQADRVRPTEFAAYELVLRGDGYGRFSSQDVNAGIDYYRRAIAVDSGYALAWARLATSLVVKTQMTDSGAWAPLLREAEQAARRALKIDPNLAYGYHALGWALQGKMEITAAEEAYRHANVLQPGIADRMLAEVQVAKTGNLAAVIETYRALLKRDPQYATLYSRLGDLLFHARQYRDSEEMLRKLIALEPKFVGAHAQLIATLIVEGRVDEALTDIEQLSDADDKSYYRSMLYWSIGRREESTALLKAIKRTPGDSFSFAELFAFRGEREAAFRELRDAFNKNDSWMLRLKYDRYFEQMRGDPRFSAMLRQLKLSD